MSIFLETVLLLTLLTGSPANAKNARPSVPVNAVKEMKESVQEPEYRVISASVTMYSGVESCHYPGCPMASGKKAYIGAAACPKEYKFGTKVMIEGRIVTCEDRTATWIQAKYGSTFDVFAGYSSSSYEDAVKFGRRELKVKIKI